MHIGVIKVVSNINHKTPKMNYAPQFITLLEKLESLMTKKGKHFRARAYSKAKDSLILYGKPIHKLDDITCRVSSHYFLRVFQLAQQ